MRLSVKRLLKNQLIHNIITLYGVQGCTYLLPLLTLPYLARILGPAGWGAVAFAQAIGAVIALVVEYGFDFSATRETARHTHNRDRLAELVSGVLGAKMLLSVLCLAIAFAVRPLTMHIAPSETLFWASAVWGVCQGVNMLWYFQGMERMKVMGGIDIGGRVLSTIGVFAFVHKPGDGWIVMVSQAAGCLLSHAVTVVFAFREVGFRWPSPGLIGNALRMGWNMFIFRASQSLSGTANGLILGAYAPISAVGIFTGAERIGWVARQALWPINQALYPRLSKQLQDSPDGAARTIRQSLKILGSLSVVFAAIIVAGAPLMIRFVLGPMYAAAAPTLRVFGLLLPLLAVCTVLSIQWMLPLGLDRQFNFVVVSSGVLAVILSFLLVPKFSHLGMALALLIQQTYSLIAICWILRAPHLNPLHDSAGRMQAAAPAAA
jgi:PST family polysaccharide transporter